MGRHRRITGLVRPRLPLQVNNFEGVSVMAVRLWFDRKVDMPASSNVFGGVDAGVGGTFFDLNALQVRIPAPVPLPSWVRGSQYK